ncbi:12563_t:CDS:1, partial [Dentiscutata heterogama]
HLVQNRPLSTNRNINIWLNLLDSTSGLMISDIISKKIKIQSHTYVVH